jgi:uncharacterized protein with HEPN domain
MSPEEKLRLTHIAEAAALIADYVQGVSKEAFFCDTLRNEQPTDHLSGTGRTL